MPGLALNCDPLDLCLWVTRITGGSHQHLVQPTSLSHSLLFVLISLSMLPAQPIIFMLARYAVPVLVF
jgi:hypothetical protein